MPVPSSRMYAFLQYLPVEAFSFIGDVGAEDRTLFTIATPGTPPASSADYGRVLYRAGWGDQSWDKVTVTFYLPPKGGLGEEMFCVCIKASAWGQLPAGTWRSMILNAVPLGVLQFPI